MSKGKPRRAIRIDDELWAAALAKAAENGEDVSTAIRRFLVRYVAGVGRPRKHKAEGVAGDASRGVPEGQL